MSMAYLCVGGPLDGQYRCIPPECISFKVSTRLPGVLPPFSGLDPIEYQLVWSSEHGHFILWSEQ